MTGLLQALHQPQGGILNSEEGIRAHVQAALAHGAVLHPSEKVQNWRVLSSGQVEVDTDRGCYTADKLVLTAGAWMPEVVPELKVNADIAHIPAHLAYLEHATSCNTPAAEQMLLTQSQGLPATSPGVGSGSATASTMRPSSQEMLPHACS